VKFVAWGQTSDRLYTGSSDGKVKAWDVRAPKGQAFIRTVLSVSGGVSSGAFSKDFSKLLIGDATGKAHLLGVDNEDFKGLSPRPYNQTTTQRHTILGRQAPKTIIPYRESKSLVTPEDEVEQTARDIARLYLEKGQLQIHQDRLIGAVQGPNYSDTRLFCFEAHEDKDSTKPLLPYDQALQQEKVCQPSLKMKLLRLPTQIKSSCSINHKKNKSLDFNVRRLSQSTRKMFVEDRIDIEFRHNDDFDLEIVPRMKIFKDTLYSKQKRARNV